MSRKSIGVHLQEYCGATDQKKILKKKIFSITKSRENPPKQGVTGRKLRMRPAKTNIKLKREVLKRGEQGSTQEGGRPSQHTL